MPADAETVEVVSPPMRGAPRPDVSRPNPGWPNPGWLNPGWPDRAGARRVAGVAGVAAASAALYLCYLWVSRTQPVPSDGASNVLEAWDMLHGNLMLHGWTLSDVSFYITELPEYMLVELLRGLGPDVVHVAAAVTYTLLVLLAGLLAAKGPAAKGPAAKGPAAKGGTAGRAGVIRALLAVGIMLAPQLGNGVHVLLQSPDHVGTGVAVLLTLGYLDRASRRWHVPVIVGLMLTGVVASDRIAIVTAVIPLAVVCAFRAHQAFARGEEPAARFELAAGAAGVAATGLAWLADAAISHEGGFALTTLITRFASGASMPKHLWLAAEGVLGLYGADFSGAHFNSLPSATAAVIAVLHLAGLGLAIWAFSRALRRFVRCDDLVVQVLALAIPLNLAAYLFSSLPYTNWDMRQISAVLPFGAILAGRLLAADLRSARLLPVLGAGLACYAAALGYGVAQPAVPAHDQPLADWLVAHHLTCGLSVYDEGNITTVDSAGKVQLRTVTWRGSAAVPRAYQSKAAWFDAHRCYADFVVSTTVDGPRSVIPYADIVGSFGTPHRTYHYGPYTIMTWTRNLFAELSGPPSPEAGGF